LPILAQGLRTVDCLATFTRFGAPAYPANTLYRHCLWANGRDQRGLPRRDIKFCSGFVGEGTLDKRSIGKMAGVSHPSRRQKAKADGALGWLIVGAGTDERGLQSLDTELASPQNRPSLAIVIASIRPNRLPITQQAGSLRSPGSRATTLAEEGQRVRCLHLHGCRIQSRIHGCRIQSRTDGGAEERARLRLHRMEQQAGCVCGLRRGRRSAGGSSSCGLNAIELQIAPIRTAVHILPPAYLAVIKEGKTLAEFDHLQETAKSMLDQLAWWTAALTTARHKTLQNAA
jgi:hypothetical protein